MLAEEWHPTLNLPLTPADVAASANRKVWWLCPNGHPHDAIVGNRHRLGSGCRFCAGKDTLSGFNDLTTLHPELAHEWHPDKNGELKPSDVRPGTHRKVWWLCSSGHAYDAEVNSRTSQGTGCRFCSGREAIKGVNDFGTLASPGLLAEWHPNNNGELRPEHVKAYSMKVVWWRCPEGHDWSAPVGNRFQGTGCPKCSGRSAVLGVTDLRTTHPDLADQWHPERNGELRPEDVAAWSNRKVWWLCPKGHAWDTIVGNRTRGGNCRFCGGKAVLVQRR